MFWTLAGMFDYGYGVCFDDSGYASQSNIPSLHKLDRLKKDKPISRLDILRTPSFKRFDPCARSADLMTTRLVHPPIHPASSGFIESFQLCLNREKQWNLRSIGEVLGLCLTRKTTPIGPAGLVCIHAAMRAFLLWHPRILEGSSHRLVFVSDPTSLSPKCLLRGLRLGRCLRTAEHIRATEKGVTLSVTTNDQYP